MNVNTCIQSLKAIKMRNIGIWLTDQLHQPGWLGNLLLDRRPWGAFSIYAHRRRSDDKAKACYSTRESAQKAANSMAKKHEVPFTVYKCLFCYGWHVSKMGAQQSISSKSPQKEEDLLTSLKTMDRHEGTNLDIEKALATGIPDIHPAYGGLRGRTLSSHRQYHAWGKLVKAGLKQVIELRADYTSNYYQNLCEKSGVEFFRYPVAKDMSSIMEMVNLFPRLCELIDRGNFYIACAQGLHRTDIALCLYWVFHAADKGIAPPPLRGYLEEEGRTPDKIIRALNAFYKCKTERDGAKPLPEEVFKKRKDIIRMMNKSNNQDHQ